MKIAKFIIKVENLSQIKCVFERNNNEAYSIALIFKYFKGKLLKFYSLV